MGNEFLENMYKQIRKPKSPLPFTDINIVLQQKEDDNMVSVDKRKINFFVRLFVKYTNKLRSLIRYILTMQFKI